MTLHLVAVRCVKVFLVQVRKVHVIRTRFLAHEYFHAVLYEYALKSLTTIDMFRGNASESGASGPGYSELDISGPVKKSTKRVSLKRTFEETKLH